MTHLIESWQRPNNIKALQTTRNLEGSNDFSIHPNHHTPHSCNKLIDTFQLPHNPCFLQQTHGSEIVEYKKPPTVDFKHQADACYTRNKNIICAVMTADCLPVLLADKEGAFIAAVHCGWRSLYADILTKTIQTINPENEVIAWFGPCIQAHQYEVGETFKKHYLEKHPKAKAAFNPNETGKICANLNQMAELQMHDLGITHIQSSQQCTYLSTEYHSWRRDKSPKRMATMAWLG